MKKRILTIVLALIMVCSLLPVTAMAEETLTVIFDANGGSGTMTPQVITGYNGELKPNEFTREYCAFDEWNTASDGSGTTLHDGGWVDQIWTNGSITLYAQWKPSLYVGGVQVTSANAANVLGDGKVSYDVNTRTLTLNGATITGDTTAEHKEGIYAEGDLKIVLQGENTVTASTDNANAIVAIGSLTLEGTGTLNATSPGYCIQAHGGDLAISGVTVSATGTGDNDRGIVVFKNGGAGGDITISSSTVTAKGETYGICGSDFTISDSTVTAEATTEYGGRSSYGIYGTNITITGSTVSATAADIDHYKHGISGSITITDSTVIAKGYQAITKAPTLGSTNWYQWTTTKNGTMTKSTDAAYTYEATHTYLKIEPIASAPATLTGTVTITGETKFGSVLTATVTGSNNTGTLSYQWYRGGVELTSATSDTYTLVQNDLNEKMKVVVTSSVQTGNIESAQTAVVEKADCLDVPTGLAGVAPSTAGGNNGKITGTTSAMAYSEYSDFRWSEGCAENETRAWHPGTYYVRYRATDTHKAGTNYATVIVPDLTPGPSTTYRDYLIHSATLSEVQQELNGVADVTSNDGVITIKLTSNINGRLDFDHNSGKFVLDMNDKIIDAGTTNEALCLNNDFEGTVKVIGSGTFKTGRNNIVYGGGKLTIGLSEGKDYFTLVKDGRPVFVDVNTGTTALSTFERGNELVLTQCNGIIRTITFHANGGTGTMAAASALDGTNYTLPSCTFTAPSGKEFKGWATTANGTVLSGTTLAVTANVDLYAIWEETTQGGGNGGGNQGGNNPTPPAPTYPSYNPPVITTPSVDVDDSTLNDAAGALGSAVLDSKAEIVPAAGYTVEKIAKLQSEGKLNLVIDKKASYDAADKALVDAAAAKKAALCTQYLDIDAVLKTDSGEVVATVKNTVKPLTITIALSTEMQQAAKDGKTLLVVRCHEGKCDYLNGTLNAEKTEITIQSAQFSTYAVIAVGSDAAKTFDGGIALYGAMALLSVGGGAALVIGKKRKD